MTEPITRERYLFIQLVMKHGVNALMLKEAIYSVALSHEPGWLDELVDPETGDTIRR